MRPLEAALNPSLIAAVRQYDRALLAAVSKTQSAGSTSDSPAEISVSAGIAVFLERSDGAFFSLFDI